MLTVRPLLADDLAACVALAAHVFRPVHSSMAEQYGEDLFVRLRPDPDAAQAAQVESLCTTSGTVALVAQDEDQVVGFAVATPDGATGMASVDLVAVHPAEQRRGIASRLVDAALDELRERGMVHAQAWVRDFPGHVPVRAVLARTGFEQMSIQPFPMYRELDETVAIPPDGVRRITEDDVDECVRFGLDAFRPVYASFERLHGPELFPRLWPDWEATEAADIRAAITDRDMETWVHEVDGRPVGFVVLATDDDHGLGDVEYVAVDPDRHGHGTGTTLVRFAVDRLREAGMAYAFIAPADDPGHAPARHVYGKAGFVPMPIQWSFMVTRL